MKISTRTRYGTRLMLYLGLRYGGKQVLLKDIANDEEISLKYLSLIIIPLKSAGLVNASRGAHGGYTLAKEPKEITVKDIFNALEGGLNFVECVKNQDVCKRSAQCVTRNLWDRLKDEMNRVMESVTLADLIKDYKTKKEVLTYSI